MQLTDYRVLRAGVQCNALPVALGDLVPVQEELRSNLLSSGMFEEVEVGHTDNEDHLVIAMCTFPEQLTAEQVAQRLEQVWLDRLRFDHWAAHSTLVERGHVELQGATLNQQHGRYVTVHVVAQQARIPAQRSAPQ